MKSLYPVILAATFLITPKAHAGFGVIMEWISQHRPERICEVLKDGNAEGIKGADVETLRQFWGCDLEPSTPEDPGAPRQGEIEGVTPRGALLSQD